MIVEKGYIYLLEKVSYIFIGVVVLLLSVFGLLYTMLHFSDIISGYSIFSPIIMLSISALTLIVGIYIIKLGIERQRFRITHKAIYPHYRIYGKSSALWNEIIIFAEIFMPFSIPYKVKIFFTPVFYLFIKNTRHNLDFCQLPQAIA